MSKSDFKVAVICSSNMNRSMEAHGVLRKNGFNVKSFGTGEKVRLPGKAPNKPNVYDFGCSYEDIYKDLCKKDKAFYTRNGLLNMLDRNRRIKKHPEKFQLSNERFTVIITCEDRVYDQVLEHFTTVLSFGNEPVHIINIDIKDNSEEATIGAFVIHDLVTWLYRSEDLDHEIDRLIVQYERKCKRQLIYSILFY
ncbi:RNA polymerase II subunit A C-terminal domain phosphatase SSU72-like [Aphis gossypii]|uniref:RNA polymerase II subunit A C-terminal domain phosphatase SSU72 n=1 Tax=Aphis gossypii TaxID=80765 RepID=A0A9P0J667_APHGO|nr:RNA polymerase II subunit A C-terminal domain phosphatase SSU72-like [Aphis gossypii]CAH1731033.1 unnamed protein product [Aphis gossypii]